jgi:E3 ubiquitin-protein transferase RMND5
MDSGSSMTAEQSTELKGVIKRCKAKLQTIGTDHRFLHSTVSKVGKAIDRHFAPDYQSIAPIDLFESERFLQIMNQTIAEHFNRQGMTDVADSLVQESRLPQETDIHLELFAELYQMWEAITQRNLRPALEWTNQYSAELEARNSTLEFKLHRLAYLQLLEQGVTAQADAISYTRAHFKKFINRFEKEIQMLMGCLIYLPMGYENTPYSHFFNNDMWVDAADSFITESCDIIGVNKDSSLEIIINSGCFALPALMNLKQIMVKNHVSGVWSGRNELPIEIDLGPQYRYHSTFTCPILKQPSTDQNPPMKLKCGHVISKDALHKLTRGLMIKCPYCPKESTVSETKKIFF